MNLGVSTAYETDEKKGVRSEEEEGRRAADLYVALAAERGGRT